jgi:outer membrane protein insertion porin family
MKKLYAACCSLLILLFASVLAAQADPLAGLKIERFEVVGNSTVASDTIRVYLGVSPGDSYDPSIIQKNFLNLWQTGLFDDIRVEAVKGDAGGVVVRANVTERSRVGAVEYRGNKNLTTAKIQEALDKEKIDLHVGNTIEQTLIRRAAEAIKKGYAEGGYEGVTVETLTEKMSTPGDQRIVFVISEGIKAKVRRISFTGNKHFSDRRLRTAMKDVKENGFISWIRKKNVYTPSKLDDDLEKVKNFYQDHGYQDVSFGDPQIVTLRGRKPRVKIIIPVTEGVIHTFGDVTVTGNSVLSSEQMIGNFPLKKGDVLRRNAVQSRVEGFQDLYQREGYIYAYVNADYQEKPNNVVDVHLDVYEGDQFHLGRLEFQGNRTTKDKVLRREVFMSEGDIMDMDTFKQSMFKIGQLGYFKITDNPEFKVNPDKKTVDVNVKGSEEGRNDVQFGGGYSETYGFFGQFQFSTRNFLGEGESIGVNFQRGRRQNFFSLSYSDPWFMDTPHSFGVSIFDRNTILPDAVGFESFGRGGNVAYGYRVSRWDTVSLIYGLQRVREHNEFTAQPDDDGNIPLPAVSDTRFTSSTVVPELLHDTRDNPFDTTRGTKVAMNLAYSGGPLGGTIDLLKPEIDLSWFGKMSRRSTFSLNAEVGQIIPQETKCANLFADLSKFNNKLCVPRSERFYVGGETSVRGFRSYSLGPKETINGQSLAVGGYKKMTFNAEYVLKMNDPVRFVLFADAGQAYAYSEKFDIGTLRYSTGVELRIFLPVFQFPLRFIYALNPDKKAGDDFQSFQFSIGNTF